ncbi:uncharacterized protein LOC129722367 [Wyeomyia smithii]|uniref:uncharacterized protein LOC129722367 n=1 Tax=Wyeomyia smithii TaxID=174621 RepID=UPI0024680AF0|nr:uncharacterized protein LOC129722367 [Wyeomyia smithii]
MGVKGKIFPILIVLTLWVSVHGRPSSNWYPEYDSDSDNAINEVVEPKTLSTATMEPSKTEISTEYKAAAVHGRPWPLYPEYDPGDPKRLALFSQQGYVVVGPKN